MATKLDNLKAKASAGDWAGALLIAAKFPDLGKGRNAILDAHLAITNPRWVTGLGKSVDDTIALGIAALQSRYGV